MIEDECRESALSAADGPARLWIHSAIVPASSSTSVVLSAPPQSRGLDLVEQKLLQHQNCYGSRQWLPDGPTSTEARSDQLPSFCGV
jgi:hypothetical protein